METAGMQKKAPGTATTPGFDPAAYKVTDPDAFAHNMLRFFEESAKAWSGLVARADSKTGPFSAATEMAAAAQSLSELARAWMSDPQGLAQAQGSLMRGYTELWNNQMRRLMGEDVQPVCSPEPGDGRFKDPEWSANPYFDFWKQAYLLTTHWAEDTLERTQGLDEREKHKAEFYLKQIAGALSPSNFPFTNPEVLRETFASNAQNLVQGVENLLHDMEGSKDLLRISQTDVSAFEVGRNLAVTPGKVVFQNDILQLIQYTPSTAQTHRTPLLIVPPWINKFYILDLTPAKSFIRYVVSQGFTVFVVSWVNPDAELAHKTFEDYMKEGVLAAADAVARETGEKQSNVLGYCVGGTLLAATLAYLAARGEQPFASATFLTTQVDFTKAGDLKLFIDEQQLRSIEEMMMERGYLDGSRMASVFNMLRPRDLIWPYIVNNYMLGKKPFPFDLLYWNQDSTRMPAANHSFYLREFYHENKLAEGDLVLSGTRLDMKKVKLPIYELAAREDHIAPAESVFIGARLFGGPVEYVMAGSGHIAGVVNPPDKPKYQHWTSTSPKKAKSFQSWCESAEEHPGSWWPHWIEWLGARSGEMIEARKPGARLGAIEDAPGSYVRTKA
jgi:polyhydroxyalkanoate synthase